MYRSECWTQLWFSQHGSLTSWCTKTYRWTVPISRCWTNWIWTSTCGSMDSLRFSRRHLPVSLRVLFSRHRSRMSTLGWESSTRVAQASTSQLTSSNKLLSHAHSRKCQLKMSVDPQAWPVSGIHPTLRRIGVGQAWRVRHQGLIIFKVACKQRIYRSTRNLGQHLRNWC